MAQEEWQTRLSEGQEAPFSGILVPSDTYRKMSASDLKSELLKEELRNCNSTCYQYEDKYDPKLVFALGVLAGVVGSVIARESVQ